MWLKLKKLSLDVAARLGQEKNQRGLRFQIECKSIVMDIYEGKHINIYLKVISNICTYKHIHT